MKRWAVCLGVLVSAPLWAAPLPLTLQVGILGSEVSGSVDDTTGVLTLGPLSGPTAVTPSADGATVDYVGLPLVSPGQGWTVEDFTVTYSVNPSIAASFSFTNNADTDQTFVFTAASVSSVEFDPSLIDGFSAVTVGDTDSAGGATASPANGFIYNAFIGSGDVQGLIDASVGGPGATVDAATGQFSGVTSIEPVNVGEVFGIRHEFTLSAGDTITVNSFFDIAVPEPGSMALLAAGLGLLGSRRRHRGWLGDRFGGSGLVGKAR